MEKPRPKFCVGEEVMVRGITTSEYDTDRTEVVAVVWVNWTKRENPSWGYQTAHQPNKSLYWFEESLRKLPPEDRLSFEEMMGEFIKPSIRIQKLDLNYTGE